MAGNVKEWCWNESAGGRMILGGGWNESSYKFHDLDAQPALAAAADVRVSPGEEYRAAATRDRTRRFCSRRATTRRETPVDDATFAILRGLYRYDPRPLNAKIERSEDTPDWRRETVDIRRRLRRRTYHRSHLPAEVVLAAVPDRSSISPAATRRTCAPAATCA